MAWPVFVTNFNRRFTGVSATAAKVAAVHARDRAVTIVGHPLPGLPAPVPWRAAVAHRGPAIWHVRRDPEMQAAIVARDVLRRPIRLVFTSAARHRHSAWPRWLISRMDAVIATSDEAAGFFPAVAAVVPHGADTEAFAPVPDRDAAWAALGYGGARGVAIIGRLRPEKGTDVFVDAMIAVCRARPDVVGLAVGLVKPADAAFVDTLRARVAAAGVSDRILFPGFLDHDRHRALLPALSLIANVARYEPFGIVPVEGMAAGTPFVCSDTGHYRAFSHGGRAGVIVPPGDADAAADAIGTLLDAPDRHAAMAAEARRLAVAHHSVVREAAAIAEVYDRLEAGENLALHRG